MSPPAPLRSPCPRPLSILVVLHDLPLGGTERVALRLADAWAKAGHEVTLLCGAATGAQAGLVPETISLVECDPPIPRALGSRGRLGRAAAEHLRRRPADILFVPGNFHWSISRDVARALGPDRPTIVAQVSSPIVKRGRAGARQWAFEIGARRRLRDADAMVTLSPYTIHAVNRLLGRRITSAIPLPALGDEVGAPRTASGKLIVAAGRLAPEKGFDVALRAFAKVADPEARLAFVGDGPLRAELRALADSLGVADRVTFAGYAPDIGPWLDRGRLLLLSSWHEGFGAVIVEALGRGRPVVATDCTPAVRDLLWSQAHGRVVRPGDVEGMAAALEAELAAPPPAPSALIEAVEAYRLTPVARAYLDVFEATLAKGAAVDTAVRSPLPRLLAPLTALFSD
ncbi:glycosyltransferase [uncultured Caulobacter sp.]|uniref:glycosyltransferase n=1 Tax=uncultured Caulobacter sp. TaxID=158749 RepID=UPI00261F91A7|nr:glycosyltransferase [uncultured Caulobacter sp.]